MTLTCECEDFKDGAEIELDLCQHCVKEVLGQYLRIGPDLLEEEAENWKKSKEKGKHHKKDNQKWEENILRGK